MKKIEKRAIMCLLLGFVLILGVGVFTYRYIAHGDDWASYEGNLDVYARGDLSKGSLYDTNGQILMKNTSSGMEFNENADVRKALMHVTGDKDNNITTGANRAFTDELIGYNLINGVYSLNNAGKDVTMTLDANVCAEAYQALDGRKGAIGVYNYETGEIICMVSSPTYDPQNPPSISTDDKSGVYINRFTSSKFPPGSIFKLVTAAASIETLDDAYSFQVQSPWKGRLRPRRQGYRPGDPWNSGSEKSTRSILQCLFRKALRKAGRRYFGKIHERSRSYGQPGHQRNPYSRRDL